MTTNHEHDHGGHSHTAGASSRRLGAALALAASFCLAEVFGGLWTGSLALLADAGHMLSDVGALSLALVATWLAKKPATARNTFGFHRAEAQAAAGENPRIDLVHLPVGLVETGLIDMEGIGVLHQELAGAHDAEAGPDLVPELGLNLVKSHR